MLVGTGTAQGYQYVLPVRSNAARNGARLAALPAKKTVNPRSNSFSVTRSFGGLVSMTGFGVERGAQFVAQPGGDPALAKEVVNRRDARWLQHTPHVAKRLGREQVALESQVAVAGLQHQRVDQSEDDQIVLLGRRLAQEVAPVVQLQGHARIGIGSIRMMLGAEPLNDRVDFDRVDPSIGRTPLQCSRQIVARTGADDEHAPERRPRRAASRWNKYGRAYGSTDGSPRG